MQPRQTRSSNRMGAAARAPLYPNTPDKYAVDEEDSDTSQPEEEEGSDIPSVYPKLPPQVDNRRYTPESANSHFYNPHYDNQPYLTQRNPAKESQIGWNIQPKPVITNESTDPINWTLIIVVAVCVVALLIGVFYTKRNFGSKKSSDLEVNFKTFVERMKLIKEAFPSQMSNTWKEFINGIRRVLFEEPTEPSIFLLLHHGDDSTSSCIARKVGSAARYTVNASDTTPLVIDGADSQMEALAGGEFTERYRTLVERHRIFIITNLQSMPATVSQSLHSFCDTVTPLVAEAVYIFTVDTKSPWRDQDSGTKVAEEVLNRAWRDIEPDRRQALIIRVTSGSVFKINSEERSTSCSIS